MAVVAAAVTFKGLDFLAAARSMDTQQQTLVAREIESFLPFVIWRNRYAETSQIPTHLELTLETRG